MNYWTCDCPNKIQSMGITVCGKCGKTQEEGVFSIPRAQAGEAKTSPKGHKPEDAARKQQKAKQAKKTRKNIKDAEANNTSGSEFLTPTLFRKKKSCQE